MRWIDTLTKQRLLNEKKIIFIEGTVRGLYKDFSKVISAENFEKLMSLDPTLNINKNFLTDPENKADASNGEYSYWLATRYKAEDPDIIAAVEKPKKAKEVKATLYNIDKTIKTKKDFVKSIIVDWMGVNSLGNHQFADHRELDYVDGAAFVIKTEENTYYVWVDATGKKKIPIQAGEKEIKVVPNQEEYDKPNEQGKTTRLDNYMAIKTRDTINAMNLPDIKAGRVGSLTNILNKDENKSVAYSDEPDDDDFSKIGIELKYANTEKKIKIDFSNLSFSELVSKMGVTIQKSELSFSISEKYKNKLTPKDTRLIYEDARWVVIVPETVQAGVALADGAHWCTANDSGEWFKKLSGHNPLYIIVDKTDKVSEKTENRWQLYFGTLQALVDNEYNVQFKDYANDKITIPGENGSTDRGGFEYWVNANKFPIDALMAIEQDSGKLLEMVQQDQDENLVISEKFTITERGAEEAKKLYYKLFFDNPDLDPNKILSENNVASMFDIVTSNEMIKKNPDKAKSILNVILTKYPTALKTEAFKNQDNELLTKLIKYDVNFAEDKELLNNETFWRLLGNIKTKEEADKVIGKFNKADLIKYFNVANLKDISNRGLTYFLNLGIPVNKLTIEDAPIEEYFKLNNNENKMSVIKNFSKRIENYIKGMFK